MWIIHTLYRRKRRRVDTEVSKKILSVSYSTYTTYYRLKLFAIWKSILWPKIKWCIMQTMTMEDESISIGYLPKLEKKVWKLKNFTACWTICRSDSIAILLRKKSTELGGLLICISGLSTLKEKMHVSYFSLLQKTFIQITHFNTLYMRHDQLHGCIDEKMKYYIE